MDQLLLDVRHALRGLRKHPTFTLVVLLTLALGIGANTAMFSIVDSVLFQPLSMQDSQDVVRLSGHPAHEVTGLAPIAYLDFREWRQQTKSFEAIAAYRLVNGSMRTSGGPERVEAIRVTSGIFTVAKVEPLLGRVFDMDAEIPGHENVAVITESMWRARFGGSRDILGRNIVIDDNAYAVIGVLPLHTLPAEALDPAARLHPEIWIPLVPSAAEQNRGLQFLNVIARIKHGVALPAAIADINTVNARIEAANPLFHKDWKIAVIGLKEAIVGNTRSAMIVLLCAIGCVLVMACVNIANLLLARTVNRRTELAVRAALGASSARLARQLATESLCVSAMGGALGLLLAFAAMHAIAHTISSFVPRAEEIHMDARTLAFTILVSGIAGLAFGLTPAVHARRLSLIESLRHRSASSTRTATWMLRSLVISQTSLALVLLVSAAIMVLSFRKLSHTSPGFAAEHVVATQINLALNRYRNPQDHARFYRQALDEVRSAPGVDAAAAISRLPMTSATQSTSYETEAHQLPPGDWPSADARIVSPGYFTTLHVPLLQGRDFANGDRSDAPLVMVVNREAAARMWPGESALGKRIQIYPEKTWRVVIGIVGDVKLKRLDSESAATLYIPFEQNPFPGASRTSYIVVRSGMNPETSYAVLKRALASIDDGQAIGPLQVLSQTVSNSISLRRFSAMLTAAFALIAAVLSLVGVYGVMSFAVSVRAQDLGIRAALGASRQRLLWWVLRQGIALALLGSAVGMLLGWASMKLLDRLAYGVATREPFLYMVVAIGLIIACAAACYFPARRAANTDPIIAMRTG